MLLNGYNTFIANALSGVQPCNGMYLVYTSSTNTPLPDVAGTDTLTDIKEALRINDQAGLIRMHNISANLKLGANKIYATTDNAEYVSGLAFKPGIYARAVMLAHLAPHAGEDVAVDYSELADPLVMAANGTLTFIDNLTINS